MKRRRITQSPDDRNAALLSGFVCGSFVVAEDIPADEPALPALPGAATEEESG